MSETVADIILPRLGDVAKHLEVLLPAVELTVPNSVIYTNVAAENPGYAEHLADHIYRERQAALAAISLAELPAGAMVLGGGEFLLAVDEQLIFEQYPAGRPVTPQSIQAPLNRRLPIEDFDGEAFLLARYGVMTWGHWLGELLPKAVVAETCFPGRFTFVMPPELFTDQPRAPWRSILQSLKAYGIDESRFLLLDDRCDYRFKRLFATTPVWSDSLIHPGVTELMRSGISPRNTRSPHARVAIKRIPGYGRALDNQAEIDRLLRANHFVTHMTGALSFLDQVEIFRNAEIVFGILGSDLTNLIYAPKGVKLITAAPGQFGDRFFYALLLDRGGQQIDLRGPITRFDDTKDRDWPLHPLFHVSQDEVANAISAFTGAPANTREEVPGPLEPGTIENEVLVGYDGYLFVAPFGDEPSYETELTDDAQDIFRHNIEERLRWANDNGAAFVHVIVPDKPTIIPELWPLTPPRRTGERYLEQNPALDGHILYPIDALTAHSADALSRTDSHLRDYGSILLATLLVEKLTGRGQRAEFEELTGRIKRHGSITGDLGRSLTQPVLDFDDGLDCAEPGFVFFSGIEGGRNGIIDLRFNLDCVYDKRLILFGDSFGREIARMLQFWYREVFFFSSYYFHEEIAELCKPDILITETVDRYMDSFGPNEEHPSFLLYPLLESTLYEPDAEFLGALNAVLNVPRKPYRDLIAWLGSVDLSPNRLSSSRPRAENDV